MSHRFWFYKFYPSVFCHRYCFPKRCFLLFHSSGFASSGPQVSPKPMKSAEQSPNTHEKLSNSLRTASEQLSDSPRTDGRLYTQLLTGFHHQFMNSPRTADKEPTSTPRAVHEQAANSVRTIHEQQRTETNSPRTVSEQPTDNFRTNHEQPMNSL